MFYVYFTAVSTAGAPTAWHSFAAPALAVRRLATSSGTSAREIAQATLLHLAPQPSSTSARTSLPGSFDHHHRAITTMSQQRVPDRARKYKEEPAPVASQTMVS